MKTKNVQSNLHNKESFIQLVMRLMLANRFGETVLNLTLQTLFLTD